MTQNKLRLIVGLGNPGTSYKMTRHNAGFMVIEELSKAFNISLNQRKFDTLFGRGIIRGIAVILAKPIAYMNRSGPPVQKLAQYFKIPSGDLLVIHDDIDLAFGRLKIKDKGGHGGHNGLKSIIETFGDNCFPRLRIGIGRSNFEDSVVDHVLSKFNSAETKILDQILAQAHNAVVEILTNGTSEAMNFFNDRRIIISR
ncbi:MAG: aminoacyl-tRNA hydrolase [Desulfobacterales bacterium]|nr:aminoacyl-tRNA hydrolase [Desulfobacterales bacterium]